MKICVVHVNCEELSGPYTKLIDANFNRVKRDDTIIVHRYVRHLKRATDTVFPFPILLNKVDVIERLVEADREKFDAAMVACSGDPAVPEARSIVSMPVVGAMEASLHLACMYGHKIGIVTVADRSWSECCEMMANGHGLGGRLAGVARISIPSQDAFTKGFTDPVPVAAEIERVSRDLAERGANAIVIGSAGLSVIASAAGMVQVSGTGVPIFDCLSVGLKFAELRADLTHKFGVPETSRVGYTERLAAKDVDRLATLFGLPIA